jgi:hypothetical protein
MERENAMRAPGNGWAQPRADIGSNDPLEGARDEAHAISVDFCSPSYAKLRNADQRVAEDAAHCPVLQTSTRVVIASFVIVALYLSFSLDTKHILKWLSWTRAHQCEGRVLFVLSYTASLIFMLPASVLALLAGV